MKICVISNGIVPAACRVHVVNNFGARIIAEKFEALLKSYHDEISGTLEIMRELPS